ncbi:MAG: hypothetical protein JWR12_2302 [Mucilaginibacter sp.]|jgi:hypothetical protein|nr:hypothetical protein [Mucilaginibacter sp.]
MGYMILDVRCKNLKLNTESSRLTVDSLHFICFLTLDSWFLHLESCISYLMSQISYLNG